MSKKSSNYLKFLERLSDNTIKSYWQSIKKYEKFHGTDIETLVGEALDEQGRVPEHQLSIIDRLEDFQASLVDDGLVYGTIQLHLQRIKRIYVVNRITIPYLTPLNPKTTKRREYIEYKDVLTKDEIRCALKHMSPLGQAKTLVMCQGGLSHEECEHLTLSAFIEETYQYHQCDNVVDALKWLADEEHPIIWATKLLRWKTKKPYYALIGSEAVNKIAEAKLYEFQLGRTSDKLLGMAKSSYGHLCRTVNRKCGFGLVADESKFRPHQLRRFHSTYIRGGVLNYEEHSLISNQEIDEMQGRGKTATQDTYIKTNPIRQKVLYAKVMNNLSLYHEYDYVINGSDVEVYLVDQLSENKKLKKENTELKKKLEKKNIASQKVQKLREELGDDIFKEMIGEILNAS